MQMRTSGGRRRKGDVDIAKDLVPLALLLAPDVTCLLIESRPGSLMPGRPAAEPAAETDRSGCENICFCLDAVSLQVGLVGRSSKEEVLPEQDAGPLRSNTRIFIDCVELMDTKLFILRSNCTVTCRELQDELAMTRVASQVDTRYLPSR